MKILALVLLVVAAASAQREPQFRVTASQPIQTFQKQTVQPQQFQRQPFQTQQFQPQPIQSQQFQPQPLQSQQAYARRPQPIYRQIPIVSRTDERDEKGYSYSFESGDGTIVQERGLVRPGSEPEGGYIVAEGSFSFVGNDGVTYTITYKADENGFQPVGAHIPTNTPIGKK